MDLIDRIIAISERASSLGKTLQTEEATKNALIMPFMQALGYDVFNPLEVVPEFTTDHGVKKGEKVDYAVKKNEQVILLVECKKYQSSLNPSHASQLFRYFSVSEARFSLLTNGDQYMFFTDLDKPNQMDQKPFFTFNISDFEKHEIEELKKFSKPAFDIDNILTTASDLKYTSAIKKGLVEEFLEPSSEFLKLFIAKSYDGRITQQVLEQFREIVKKAQSQFISEKINDRLQSALNQTDKKVDLPDTIQDETADFEIDDGIETTQEELEAYNVVKAILRKKVAVERIALRDTKSYCGVLLDDNNRKPLCRFHFNTKQKYIGLMENKNETRHPIESVDDIFSFEEVLLKTLSEYG